MLTGRIRQLHIQLRLLIVPARAGRHLAGEYARRDAIDADLGAGKGRGHHAGQVDEARFARGVRELAPTGALHDTRDRGNIHDR